MDAEASAGGAIAAAPQSKAWEWEGRVVSAVPAATADEAWALLSDFLAFHRWHPRVPICRLASGAAAPAAGCVRYCEGTPPGDGTPADWAHETLLEHDQARRFFRYEMNDNNMGFGDFFAAFRVVPAPAPAGGCELRWEFQCEARPRRRSWRACRPASTAWRRVCASTSCPRAPPPQPPSWRPG
ncbi:hypothetical protein ACQ4PT_007025 [Festuca glaucescens]